MAFGFRRQRSRSRTAAGERSADRACALSFGPITSTAVYTALAAEPVQGFLAGVSRYSAGFLRVGVGLTLWMHQMRHQSARADLSLAKRYEEVKQGAIGSREDSAPQLIL